MGRAPPTERITIAALTNLQEEFDEALHHIQVTTDAPNWVVGPALPVPSAELVPGAIGWKWSVERAGTGGVASGGKTGAIYIVTIPVGTEPKAASKLGSVFATAAARKATALERTSRSPFLAIGVRDEAGGPGRELRAIARAARTEFERDE